MAERQFTSLDVLWAYTAQFEEADYDAVNDKFFPHEPISAEDGRELVRKWKTGSVTEKVDADGGIDRAWTLLQALADDYDLPLDEYLGAVWFVSQHNGAYQRMSVQDQIGCAMGEVTRVLQAFRELQEQAEGAANG